MTLMKYYLVPALNWLVRFKIDTQSQLQSHQYKFKKSKNPKLDESTIIKSILIDFEKKWETIDNRLMMVPGKDFLSALNALLQKKYKISLSQANIISAIKRTDIPTELQELIEKIDKFRKE